MISALIGLFLALSAGATVAVSDDAKPGDALYGVDRASERVRLAFAGEEGKAELKVRYANERLTELEEVIAEESEDEDTSDEVSVGLTEAEATIYTNETIVKTEFNDAKEILISTSTEATMLENEIAAYYGISAEEVHAVLTIETEDRASRPEDRTPAIFRDSERVEGALENAVSYLSEVRLELEAKGNVQAEEAVQTVIDRLLERMGTLPSTVKASIEVKVEDDGSQEIRIKVEDESDEDEDSDEARGEDDEDEVKTEIRADGIRTKVEIKDGETRTEVKTDDDDNDDATEIEDADDDDGDEVSDNDADEDDGSDEDEREDADEDRSGSNSGSDDN